MLKKFPNLTLGLVFVVVLAAAAAQGRRVDHLRDCDRFYRWIISACTQVRIFGIPGTAIDADSKKEDVDVVLFKELIEQTDRLLPDIPTNPSDYDKDGKEFPKIVRYTAAPPDPKAEKSKQEGLIESEDQIERDWELWKLAQGKELASLRHEFLVALRSGTLTSSGSQLKLSGLYEEKGTTISLANMFLGFRKMAANLVWLEVDKLWHSGAMYAMIPMMKTCVTLDPTFVDAFLVGAWHLSYNTTALMPSTPYELRRYVPEYEDWLGDKEQFYYSGIEFLKDGIRKNPREYKLYFDLGYGIYDEKLHNTPMAIRYLSEATRLYHDRWVPRQLYRLKGENEQYEESKAGWQSYLAWQPDNKVAPRFISLMDGAIKERTADWASYRARAAEELAARERQKGQDQLAAEWETKAASARDAETKGYREARDYWQKIVDESKGEDTYALARVLVLNGRERVQQGRYIEAIVDFDRARWATTQYWEEGTRLMVDTKVKANEPLSLTERREMEREEKALAYTRHLPKSIGGQLYKFSDGTWIQTGGAPADAATIDRDSDALLELVYEHPEIAEAVEKLDGNIVLRVGDTWRKITSGKPALASKLYTPAAG